MKRTAALLLVIIITLCACTPSAPNNTDGVAVGSPAPDNTQSPPSSEDYERFSTVGFYFDTVITIIAYAKDAGILNTALERCAYYENLLSKTIEGSDVWRINHANGMPAQVSEHTRLLVETALAVGELSKGSFDISIAPVMELWDFTGGTALLPDVNELNKAAELVDYRAIKLEGSSVTIPKGCMIDLGAIAKGYIADEIASFLKESGIKSGILNFGGNVVVIGEKPDGSAWNVGIQNPEDQTGTYVAVVQAVDSSVVTSGIYERGFDLDGVRYHHILDTSTGWPVDNELESVSILSKSSMMGDALSTTCLTLGLEAAQALLSGLDGVEAVFITKDGNITATNGARDMLTIDK